MSNIEVKVLTKSDAALFRSLRLEALKNNPEAFTSSYQDEAPLPLERFEEQIMAGEVFVAYKNHEPVGLSALGGEKSGKRSHIGRLWAVYVREQARHSGVGKALMNAVIEHAKKKYELIELTVSAINTSAQHLYERVGFVQYGHEEYAEKYEDRYCSQILMMKLLKNLDH